MKGIFEREREIGFQEGFQESLLEGMRLSVLHCLRHRFQTVPKTLEKKLLSIQSTSMLEEIFDAAMDAQSMREFTVRLKEIQQYGGALATSGK